MVPEQLGITAVTAKRILGLIRGNVVNKEDEIIKTLYIVRPNPNYCIAAWRSYLKKDVAILEIIQRKATNMITVDRLKQCKLRTLETTRIRGDHLEVFKTMHGFEDTQTKVIFRGYGE